MHPFHLNQGTIQRASTAPTDHGRTRSVSSSFQPSVHSAVTPSGASVPQLIYTQPTPLHGAQFHQPTLMYSQVPQQYPTLQPSSDPRRRSSTTEFQAAANPSYMHATTAPRVHLTQAQAASLQQQQQQQQTKEQQQQQQQQQGRNPQKELFDKIEAHHEKVMIERAPLTDKISRAFRKAFSSEKSPEVPKQPVPQVPSETLSRPSSAPAIVSKAPTITMADVQNGITPDTLSRIVQLFQADGLLPKDVVIQILYLAEARLQTLSNVNRIQQESIYTRSRTVIVGDLHGQYGDLCYILSSFGSPSNVNSYLFNGDFVDRGPKSFEVAITLFGLLLAYPDSVYLNRGNHELRSINIQYGFQTELARKKYDVEVYEAFQQAFNALPVIAVVGGKVIVVHGGVTDKISSWKDIEDQDRLIDATRQSIVIDDMLWSDPRDEPGCSNNSRGAGLRFGPNITEGFLQALGCTTLIRSHEVKDNGYEVTHNGRCITLFSASNYTGTYGNKGAVAILDHASRLHMFTHTSVDAQRHSNLIFDESKLEQTNLLHVAELIFEKKLALTEAFRQKEAEEKLKNPSLRRGSVSKLGWLQVMDQVLGVDFDWEALRGKIAPSARPDCIDYSIFLNQYEIDDAKLRDWEEKIAKKVAESIFQHKGGLSAVFASMDHNKDGTLSYAEFQQAVEGMNLGLSKEQITYFALSLDQDNDGTVSYNEFLSRFKMKFRKPLGFLSQEEAAEVEKLVDELGELLYSRSMTLQEAFSSFDKDNSGYITVDELSIALRETLGLHLTPFQVCNPLFLVSLE
eukprot:TRINITY_DN1129_c0_g4_i1.p1 TRINITY_DN1129_c0_g4~~TRINITY_DN1129_c0_g4_i1.p1  ORF type:complete len:796 (-),score=165.92 TRINITY_DN1129_c0_g4_i1:939-3326(-)